MRGARSKCVKYLSNKVDVKERIKGIKFPIVLQKKKNRNDEHPKITNYTNDLVHIKYISMVPIL